MKGYLAQQAQETETQGVYSNLKVMKSPAGWYIGTVFMHKEGWQEPGSRESEYFKSEEDAKKALDNESWDQRLWP